MLFSLHWKKIEHEETCCIIINHPNSSCCVLLAFVFPAWLLSPRFSSCVYFPVWSKSKHFNPTDINIIQSAFTDCISIKLFFQHIHTSIAFLNRSQNVCIVRKASSNLNVFTSSQKKSASSHRRLSMSFRSSCRSSISDVASCVPKNIPILGNVHRP